jgi:hypothetical protein
MSLFFHGRLRQMQVCIHTIENTIEIIVVYYLYGPYFSATLYKNTSVLMNAHTGNVVIGFSLCRHACFAL